MRLTGSRASLVRRFADDSPGQWNGTKTVSGRMSLRDAACEGRRPTTRVKHDWRAVDDSVSLGDDADASPRTARAPPRRVAERGASACLIDNARARGRSSDTRESARRALRPDRRVRQHENALVRLPSETYPEISAASPDGRGRGTARTLHLRGRCGRTRCPSNRRPRPATRPAVPRTPPGDLRI